jgi:hypothetical protein
MIWAWISLGIAIYLAGTFLTVYLNARYEWEIDIAWTLLWPALLIIGAAMAPFAFFQGLGEHRREEATRKQEKKEKEIVKNSTKKSNMLNPTPF